MFNDDASRADGGRWGRKRRARFSRHGAYDSPFTMAAGSSPFSDGPLATLPAGSACRGREVVSGGAWNKPRPQPDRLRLLPAPPPPAGSTPTFCLGVSSSVDFSRGSFCGARWRLWESAREM